ncbi:6-phosphofructokinase [Anaerosinus massiliensis]|uniref:6-phosphofructokinase n=1 Tax=Massilibacillus massiliensis TaxID=1806837 RepID=UPI0018FE736A|nr:6-phosphofructokinase [Massilibacillus massiliensis]
MNERDEVASMTLMGKAVVAQGGGPTAVINQSLVGIIEEAKKHPEITQVYGAVRGVEGIVNEEFLDLTQETTRNLSDVAMTPSSALLSTRVRPDQAYCREILKVLQAHEIRYFFYIGGNDSSDTVRIVNAYAEAEGYELKAIHVPKTIDNDLVGNDHTPGFGSAARFVMQAFSGINLDVKALGGIYIGVIMGRHAGFLTASASAARKFLDDGPHLIYLPERPFEMETFLADVKRVHDRLGRCIIAVSEGIADEEGVPIITKHMKRLEVDAHGNVSMSGNGTLGDLLVDKIKETLKIKRVRADTFGYIQRSFLGTVSDIDQQEAREVGEKAVQFAVLEHKSGAVCVKRVGTYAVEYDIVPIEEVAGLTRKMPDAFISEENNDVTPAFKTFIMPLLGSSIPQTAILRAPKVPKLIHKED